MLCPACLGRGQVLRTPGKRARFAARKTGATAPLRRDACAACHGHGAYPAARGTLPDAGGPGAQASTSVAIVGVGACHRRSALGPRRAGGRQGLAVPPWRARCTPAGLRPCCLNGTAASTTGGRGTPCRRPLRDCALTARGGRYGFTLQQGAAALRQLGIEPVGISSTAHYSFDPQGAVLGCYGASATPSRGRQASDGLVGGRPGASRGWRGGGGEAEAAQPAAAAARTAAAAARSLRRSGAVGQNVGSVRGGCGRCHVAVQ